jgi:hypothetical protein
MNYKMQARKPQTKTNKQKTKCVKREDVATVIEPINHGAVNTALRWLTQTEAFFSRIQGYNVMRYQTHVIVFTLVCH